MCEWANWVRTGAGVDQVHGNADVAHATGTTDDNYGQPRPVGAPAIVLSPCGPRREAAAMHHRRIRSWAPTQGQERLAVERLDGFIVEGHVQGYIGVGDPVAGPPNDAADQVGIRRGRQLQWQSVGNLPQE